MTHRQQKIHAQSNSRQTFCCLKDMHASTLYRSDDSNGLDTHAALGYGQHQHGLAMSDLLLLNNPKPQAHGKAERNASNGHFACKAKSC